MERRCWLKAVFPTIWHAMLRNRLIQMGWSQVPLQENDSDCGLFLLHYIRKFVESAPKTMKMSDVENRLEDIGLVSCLSNTFNQSSNLSAITAHSWTQVDLNSASLLLFVFVYLPRKFFFTYSSSVWSHLNRAYVLVPSPCVHEMLNKS